MEGIRKKKTMITPWSGEEVVVGLGLDQVAVRASCRLRRMSVAAAPPMKKKKVIEIM